MSLPGRMALGDKLMKFFLRIATIAAVAAMAGCVAYGGGYYGAGPGYQGQDGYARGYSGNDRYDRGYRDRDRDSRNDAWRRDGRYDRESGRGPRDANPDDHRN
jgi:anaerobic selenocysteine-containing dehydrogenase